MTDKLIADWGTDGFFFTEAARGGSLPWRVGQAQLEGDALGPVRHAHDDAAEYYYMFRGSAHVETGGVEFVLEEGQLGYIPPDAPHNFTGPASDVDACLFCLIVPNFPDNKWRVSDFLPGTESLRMAVATPFEDDELPGDDKVAAHALELSSSTGLIEYEPEGSEVVYLVIDGVADFQLANGLHGPISAGTFLHLREGTRHSISASSPAKVLRFDCFYEAWRGVATAADVPATQGL